MGPGRPLDGFCRFALGLGEAGVWPAASKAVSEWFPARERALAIGFYTMGATDRRHRRPLHRHPARQYDYAEKAAVHQSVGHGTGWRVAFIVTGAAGLFWLIPWLFLYRKPRATGSSWKELRTHRGTRARNDLSQANGKKAMVVGRRSSPSAAPGCCC
jgi:MFS family permease